MLQRRILQTRVKLVLRASSSPVSLIVARLAFFASRLLHKMPLTPAGSLSTRSVLVSQARESSNVVS